MAVGWFFKRQGQSHGPVSAVELKRLADAGELARTDLVRKEDGERWVPAVRVKGLFPQVKPEETRPQAPSPPVVLEAELVEVEEVSPTVNSKWAKVYGRPVTQAEALLLDAFHRHMREENGLYLFPSVPDAQAQTLTEFAPLYPNDLPLCLYVLTDAPGWLLTTQHIYLKDTQHGPRRCLPLRRVKARDMVRGKAFFISKTLQVAPNFTLPVNFLGDRALERLEDFLEEGSRIVRRNRDTLDPANWEAAHGRPVATVEKLFLRTFDDLVEEDASLYVAPMIPPQKLAGAREGYATLNATELVLGVVDSTTLGSASVGCTVTSRGVYWLNSGGEPGHLRYEQIDPEQVQATTSLLSGEVSLGKKTAVDVSTLAKPTAQALADFLREAATVADDNRVALEALETDLALQMARRLASEPQPSTCFRCAGCGVPVTVAAPGQSVTCPRCRAGLVLPEKYPCPRCRSRDTRFLAAGPPSALTRAAVGLAAHAAFGLLGGIVAAGMFHGTARAESVYDCRACGNAWALRLTQQE